MPNLTIIFVGIYLALLPLIGILGRLATRNETLRDYYLAGGVLGLVPLFFTFYATQYSGNTLLGFAGNAYRSGPVALFSALGMMFVVIVLFAIGRRLHAPAQAQSYVTVSDFFRARFKGGSGRVLASLITLVLFFGLASYILTNFKAIGLLVETISGGAIPFVVGVFVMAIIMAFYESLGGMRSVVWTDMLQGSLLLVGCGAVTVAVIAHFGGVIPLLTEIAENPASNWQKFDTSQWIRGLSLAVLLGGGVALYPHAIQRIYAARNIRILNRSFALMVAMPLLTTLPIIISAIAATHLLPTLSSAAETDQILPRLIGFLSANTPSLKYLLALFMAAALAAIMSTIDSALLSMGSIFTQDVIAQARPNIPQAQLTRLGRWLSWLLMMMMAGLAVIVPQTIWWLLVLKLEIMIQVLPSFIIALYLPRARPVPLTCGLLGGIAIMLGLKFGGAYVPPLHGLHAGIVGLLANIGLYFGINALTTPASKPR